MKQSTKNALWIGGIVLGGAAILGGVAWAASRPATNKSIGPGPTGPVYDPTKAIPVTLTQAGLGFMVPIGSSVTAFGTPTLWDSPGVVSSDATVLAPTETTNGFIATKKGTATLTGSYQITSSDPNNPAYPITQTVTVSAQVTVV